MPGNIKSSEKFLKTKIYINSNYFLQKDGAKTTRNVNISNLPKTIAKIRIVFPELEMDP